MFSAGRGRWVSWGVDVIAPLWLPLLYVVVGFRTFMGAVAATVWLDRVVNVVNLAMVVGVIRCV